MPTAAIGLFSMCTIFVVSLLISAKHITTYIDPLSFLIVAGCTVGSALLQFPLNELKLLFGGFKLSLFGKPPKFSDVVHEQIDIAIAIRDRKAMDEIKGMATDPLTEQALGLIENQIPVDKISFIMTEQLLVAQEKDKQVIDIFAGLGKLPPTFGMMGTVIGLVGLLENLGGEGGAQAMGAAMAVALVTTLYGVVTANFFLDPVASNLKIKQNKMRTAQKIILKGIIMSSDATITSIEIQEALNAYLDEEEKVDVLQL